MICRTHWEGHAERKPLLKAINRTGRLWSHLWGTQPYKKAEFLRRRKVFHFESSRPTETAGLYYNKFWPVSCCCLLSVQQDGYSGGLWSSQRRMCGSVNICVCVFVCSVNFWTFRCCSYNHSTKATTAVTFVLVWTSGCVWELKGLDDIDMKTNSHEWLSYWLQVMFTCNLLKIRLPFSAQSPTQRDSLPSTAIPQRTTAGCQVSAHFFWDKIVALIFLGQTLETNQCTAARHLLGCYYLRQYLDNVRVFFLLVILLWLFRSCAIPFSTVLDFSEARQHHERRIQENTWGMLLQA